MDKPVESYLNPIRLPGIGPHLAGRPWWVGYVVALLLVGAMAGLRIALAPVAGVQNPLLAFLLVIVLAGYLGGRGPALVAVAGSVIAAHLVYWPIARALLGVGGWVVHILVFSTVGLLLAEGIHWLQQATRALSDSEHRLRSILDKAAAVVFLKDRAGRYAYVNSEVLRVSGFRPEQFIGKTEHEIFPPRIADAMRANDLRVWESGAPITTEESLSYNGGPTHHYIATKFLLEDSEGKPYLLCGIMTDITRQKRTEEALRLADRRKDIFLATLAHELRNPLAPIRHAVTLLKMPGLSREDAARARDIIDRQSQLMGRLLDDLLDVSRITRGSLELRMRTLDVASVIEPAVESVRPLMEARRHTVTIDVPPTPMYVQADAVRLSQVVANLLTNAAKYTEPGGRITLRAHRDGQTVVLRVIDTGIGIEPELLPHIFEMFSQGKSELQHAEGGLGIGLALVRGLLELHGGSVEARSEGPGRGSEFIVRLPAVTAPASADSSRDNGASAGSQTRCRILVADDNRDAADSLGILLEGAGHHVRKAYDGRAALEAAEAFRPDVVLLDIGMPGMDGYEVARRIRAQRWGREMTLVALTGWGQSQDRERARAAGFDHHITKPLEPERLANLLDSTHRAVNP
jgi:PAS domain S-box-containing protein